MADHNKPVLTSTYTNFVSELDARFDDLALGLDPAVTSATNLPVNTLRWNSALGKDQKWNGSSWTDKSVFYNFSNIRVNTDNEIAGYASAVAINHTGGGTQFGISIKATTPGDTNHITFHNSLGISTGGIRSVNGGTSLVFDGDLSNSSEYLKYKPSEDYTVLDTLNDNAFRAIGYPDANRALVSMTVNGSVGVLQHEYLHSGSVRWRNKTDGTTWTQWRQYITDTNIVNYGSGFVVSKGNLPPDHYGNNRGPFGLNMWGAYANGYPVTYGNVLHMTNTGSSQLLLGWSGSDGQHADNYVRSKRDNDTGAWSPWTRLVTEANIDGIVAPMNVATATKLQSNRTNWVGTGVKDSVVGGLTWNNYGNNHVVFDASAGTSPSGEAISDRDPANPWSPSFPTLMGWNGVYTYGVRVDSARVADSVKDSIADGAVATTQSGADRSGKVATTQWVQNAMSTLASNAGFIANFANNGYVKFPDWLGGLIIQWGSATSVNGTLSFPITFTVACYSVSVSGPNGSSYIASAGSRTTTGFDAFGFFPNNGRGAADLSYIAIGK